MITNVQQACYTSITTQAVCSNIRELMWFGNMFISRYFSIENNIGDNGFNNLRNANFKIFSRSVHLQHNLNGRFWNGQ